MPALHVTKPGAVLRRISRRIVVESEGERLADVPVRSVERILLHGPATLTAPVIALVLSEHIPVAFLTTRGRYRGQLVAPCGKDALVRAAQADRRHDEDFRAAVARALVRAKLQRAADVARRHAANHPDPPLLDLASRIEALSRELSGSVDEIRGMEGEAAALWFEAFGRMLRNGMAFVGRSRRPPMDPPNALLGYLYAMALAEAVAACAAVGLDPAIGSLHGLHYGRDSLALDLLEPHRPLVDRFVLRLLNLGVLREEHFVTHPDAGGCFLTEDGRRTVIERFEREAAASGPRCLGIRERTHAAAEEMRRWIRTGRVRGLDDAR